MQFGMKPQYVRFFTLGAILSITPTKLVAKFKVMLGLLVMHFVAKNITTHLESGYV